MKAAPMDQETNIATTPLDRLKLIFRRYSPGILLAVLIAISARYLSEHYGGPVMLYALLIGMAFHFLYEEGPCRAGLVLTAKKVLRIGVALLGLRISFDQVVALGLSTLVLIVAAVLGSLLVGIIVAKIFGRSARFGLLTGGSVGICGASAALAISSVLPASRENETDTLFTVIAVTTLSTIAMVVYPAIASSFGLNDVQTGIMFGATIHDVAQVIGAGFAVSDTAGETATIVKLLRVMMLLPVLLVVSIVTVKFLADASQSKSSKTPIPWFAFGFAALVFVNSMGWVPEAPKALLIDASRWCLVAAISALGVMTTLKAMIALGPKHIAVVVIETLILLGAVIAAIFYLM